MESNHPKTIRRDHLKIIGSNKHQGCELKAAVWFINVKHVIIKL